MKEQFDQFRDGYEATVESSIAFSGLKHDFFMEAKAVVLQRLFNEHLGANHKPNLLDVGCGVGRAHPYLLPIADRLTGTDPSLECVERARLDNPGVSYRVGDGRALPFETGEFEAAVAVCVLHHVPPRDWSKVVSEMKRVVQPGGLVAIIEHNPYNPGTRLAVARCPFDADATLLSSRRTERLCKEAGLTQVQSNHFLLFPSKRLFAQKAEHRLGKLPLGAQYITAGKVL